MPRNYKKGLPGKRPIAPKVSGVARLKAKHRVWEMISRCYGRDQCLVELTKAHGLTIVGAEQLYAEVWREIRVVDEATIPERRQKLLVMLEDLYQAAYLDRQFAACAMAIREIKKMFGVDQAIKLQLQPAGSGDDISRRSDAELEYHDQHGYWPEEAGKQAPVLPPPKDPLEALH